MSTIALMVYNLELSIWYYAYLANPLVEQHLFLWAQEAWLYMIHMLVVVLMDWYFVAVFLLPCSGPRKDLVALRETVIRAVERPEQLKLLLEGDFTQAIADEAARKGASSMSETVNRP